MPSLGDISASIDARIVEVRNEIMSLEAARDALRRDGAVAPQSMRNRRGSRKEGEARAQTTNGARVSKRQATAERSAVGAAAPEPTGTVATPGAASHVRRPRRRGAKAGTRRPVKMLGAGELEAILRDAPQGLSAVAIAKAANARDTQVRELLTDRQAAGQVRRIGSGRGTRWRLVTDEERIAERAAELQQRSSRAA